MGFIIASFGVCVCVCVFALVFVSNVAVVKVHPLWTDTLFTPTPKRDRSFYLSSPSNNTVESRKPKSRKLLSFIGWIELDEPHNLSSFLIWTNFEVTIVICAHPGYPCRHPTNGYYYDSWETWLHSPCQFLLNNLLPGRSIFNFTPLYVWCRNCSCDNAVKFSAIPQNRWQTKLCFEVEVALSICRDEHSRSSLDIAHPHNVGAPEPTQGGHQSSPQYQLHKACRN